MIQILDTAISIPVYSTASGTVSAFMEYDCGNGLKGDGSKSYLAVVTGTTAAEFQTYVNTLRDAGYEGFKTWEIESNRNPDTGKTVKDPNRFVTCTINGVKLYAYHFPAYNETRLIVDTQADTVEGYVYEAGPAVAQVSLTSYGLSISENGYDITTTTINSTGKRNCGALVVIRMPDNSVFINDGGDIQQWNDEISADFMKYLRQLTGTPAGEKVVVNTWFVSHAHSDHFLGFPQFLARHHEELDIKNVMYNIDIERFFTTRDISGIMSTIRSFYPNVRYYKPHTGETIEIAGVKMDVLYTLEDRYLPNAEGKLITDYPTIKNGQATTAYDVGGTYRDNMYEEPDDNGVVKSDFNDTSVVLRVHLSDTVDSILYADANLAENVIMNVYPDSALATDIMMIPHHGHDAHRELCRLSNAKIFLYTQHKQAIFGLDGKVETEDKDENGVVTYRSTLRNNYLEMQKYIETEGSQTYWEGNETVCIMVGDDIKEEEFPSDVGLTKTTAPDGFTVYSSPAPTYVYEEPKSEESAPSVDAGSGWSGGLAEVTTNTKTFRYDLVTTDNVSEKFAPGKKYVIVDGSTGNIFMHDPVNDETTSMLAGTSAQATSGDVDAYFNSSKEKLYFAHHNRDQAMWILSESITANKTTKALTSVKAKFGGTTAYRYTGFVKGMNSAAEPYWTATGDADTIWLQPNRPELIRAAASSYNVYTEFFDDGTCVIYYYRAADSTDGTTAEARFLIFDEETKQWRQEVIGSTNYTTDAKLKAAVIDTETNQPKAYLKLRLYSEYIAGKDLQTVAYDGKQHTVLAGTQENVLATVANNIVVKDTSRYDIPIPYSATPKAGYYHLAFQTTYKPGQAGDYMVDIYYRNDDGTDTKVGGVTLHVVERVLVSATINNNSGIVSKGSNVGTHVQSLTTQGGSVKDCTITATFRNADGSETTETVCVSVGMLTYGGKPIDTNQVGFYNSVTVTYRGQKLTNAFNLTVSDSSDYLNYPVYPEPGSVIVNKQGTTSEEDFALTGVANIQLSATGIPTGKGVDLIVVVDLSGSMENAVDTNDDAPVGSRRIDIATRTIKNMVAQLRTMPGADVRIAMSDFGDLDSHEFQGVIIDESIANEAFFDVNFNNSYARRNAGAGADYYEFSNYLNFPFKDSNHDDGLSVNGSDPDATAYTIVNSKFNIANPSYMGHTIPGYSGKVIPTIYTGSGQANADAFVNVSTLDANAMDAIEAAMWNNVRYSIGTNYDVGLEYAYQLGYAIQQQNIAEGLDREVVCIFMSDGAPMQFNYFSGRAVSSTWSDWITGNADGIHQVHAEYTKDNKPADLVKIEKILMARLKNGTLATPDCRRGELQNAQYFTYNADKTAGCEYFYTYMDTPTTGVPMTPP